MSLAKSDLQDVLREMLLIRRFEQKVEERFRAGELKLELDERPRVIGNALGGVGESVHGVLLTTTQGP